jgi:D-glycero-D-manno-heptose 1,7-bisphosphate phosphatase
MILKKWNIDKTWSLFLDRDGVINQRIIGDYVRTLEDFIFLEGVVDTIAKFGSIFGRIVVVTNQQGISKGLIDENDLHIINTYILEKIPQISKIYYCPHLIMEECLCRKPNNKMALDAKIEFSEIDFSKSLMIGDSQSDIDFGKSLGMKTISIGDAFMNADASYQSLASIELL